MTEAPPDVLETFGASHMASVIKSNQHAYTLNETECERLLDVADKYETPHFVTADWDEFCRDTFGESNYSPNYYAIGEIDWEVSGGRGAWLLKDAYAVQQQWLETGDGRMSSVKQIDVSDTKYVDEKGTCWCPKEYTFVCQIGE